MSTTKYKQNLDVTGDITLSGNINIGGGTIAGDADTDSITFNADVTSHIIPDGDATYDIGTSTKTWREVFTSKINSASGDDLDIHSGSDIALYPAGNIWIKQNTKLIFEGTVPDDFEAKLQATSVTADRDIILPDRSGTIALQEDLTDGSIDLDVNSLTVSGAGTTSISAGADITLDAVNKVIISDTPLKLANLTTTERDTFTPANGDLIYNTTTNQFEAYENGTWQSLGTDADISALSSDSIADADGDTRVEVEQGADDDTIRFTSIGSEMLRVSANALDFGTTVNRTFKIESDLTGSIGASFTMAHNSPTPANGDEMNMTFQHANDSNDFGGFNGIESKILNISASSSQMDTQLMFRTSAGSSNSVRDRFSINKDGMKLYRVGLASGSLTNAKLTFESDGGGDIVLIAPTTASTRTLTFPDTDGTLATEAYVTANAGGGGSIPWFDFGSETQALNTTTNSNTFTPNAANSWAWVVVTMTSTTTSTSYVGQPGNPNLGIQINGTTIVANVNMSGTIGNSRSYQFLLDLANQRYAAPTNNGAVGLATAGYFATSAGGPISFTLTTTGGTRTTVDVRYAP